MDLDSNWNCRPHTPRARVVREGRQAHVSVRAELRGEAGASHLATRIVSLTCSFMTCDEPKQRGHAVTDSDFQQQHRGQG